ncbi:MAG: hypothetical protein ACXU9L_00880 [Thermodesulfobacteriota bacterium]
MRCLQRWTVIFALMIAIFGCGQKSTSPYKANSEPDGFGGITWGTPFSEVKSDLVELRSTNDPAEPSVKIKIYYTKKGDSLKMGAAQLDQIEYVFWRRKFAEVRISTSGPENFNGLKQVLFERYGTVDKSQGAYSWDGSVTRITLRYDEPTRTTLLSIASTKLASAEVKDIFDKDKD